MSVLPKEATEISSLRKILNIAFAFVVIGPMVGFLSITLFLLALALISLAFQNQLTIDQASIAVGGASLAALVLPLAYLYGALPALLAGLLIGAVHTKCHGVRSPVVLAIAFLIGAGCSSVARYAFVRKPSDDLITAVDVLLAGASIISTFTCWTFVRKWYLDEQRLGERVAVTQRYSSSSPQAQGEEHGA